MESRGCLIGEIATLVLGFSQLERSVMKTELWDLRGLKLWQLDALVNMLKEAEYIPDYDVGEWLLEVRAYVIAGSLKWPA